MLTQERLKSVLHYDHLSGVFTWKVNTKRIAKGFVAGHVQPTGYIRIAIDGKQYKSHRLAWLYMTGSMPNGLIDHINNIRSDNRWANLRVASSVENSLNRSISRRNSSGVKGVHWSKEKCKWLVQIKAGGQRVQIGSFEDIELAQLVINEAREKYHREFSNHGR